MKKNKNLIYSLVFLAFTVLLLLTSTFAWMSIATNANANNIIVTSGKFDVEITLSINKNNSGYVVITTDEQLVDLLDLSVPGNSYDFKLEIENKGTSSLSLDVVANGVTSENDYEEYNLFDVYQLLNGDIIVDGVSSKVATLDESDDYRLSNIVNNDSFIIAKSSSLAINGTKTILFSLYFDHETTNIRYSGIVNIEKINIYMNEGE